jgi:hypothetical protein
MLQSDRQASGNRGQVELFGETQFWTFDDHCHAFRKDDGFLTTSQKVIAYLIEAQPLLQAQHMICNREFYSVRDG